jgi:diguanylate cyclase (GGDEF)-like protein
MTAETGLAEANWLREHGTPEIKELIAKIDEALGPAKTAVDERRAARAEDAAVLGQMQDLEEGSRGSVPQTPFIQGGDKKEGDRFNVNGEATYALGWALPILDASERGFEHFVWSDADNRMKNASLPRGAGKLVYDRWAAQQIRKLLKFAKIDLPADAIKHVYIRGEGHWYLHLTREMRDAIKRYGLPILGIMALTPSDSKAQPAEGEAHVPETPHLMYLTAVGGVAAGMALAALAHSKRLRRLVRENADLRRELMLDDLSGVSNRKAFSLAKSVVDNDDAVSWVVADGNRFKMLNDKHGHPAGDKAIQHFGKQIIRVAEELDVSPRAFRIGGDEFAVAIPKDKAAEFRTKLEEASSYSVGAGDEKVTTSLTGAVGNTFDEADALLGAFKSAAREADPTLGREAHLSPVRKKIEGMENGATFYANPIPQALREVMRYPSAVALAGVATALNSSDDPDLQATAKPVYALAVLNAIGSRRLIAGKDKLVSSLLGKLARTEEGLKAVRALNPEALLSPDVKSAIQQYERERSRAKAKAAETSRAAKQLGPKGDRAVSDVLENEQWEDVSQMAPDELKATLAIATKIDNEYQQSATELLQTGARQPGELLENYAGPRRYAYYEAQHAQTEGRPGAGGGRTPRISATKSRTLDIPIRNAEDALARAQASGDPSRIQDAQDALTEARLVQMSKRTELGEIREASYRAAQGIERAYADAAAARLFVNLRDLDGVVHPEWNQAMTDLDAAKAAKSAAATPADKQAAQTLIDEAKVRLHELTRQYQRRGEAYVALPDVRSLGKLRGAIVNRDVYNSLVGFTDREGWYGQLLRRWKEIKTVFNPGTHQGNIFSNIGFAHMEGLNLWEQPMYLKRAAADMKSYGPATKALAEAGILDVNAVTADEQGIALRDVARREGLEELSKTTRPETADVLRREGISGETQRRRRRRTLVRGAVAGAALGGAKMASDEEPEGMALGVVAGAAIGAGLGAIREQVRRTYNNEDNIFRAAIWLKKVESGMRPEDATAYTRNALGNFRSRSPALQVLRSTISPFVLYPAKALPRLGQQIIDHPWRYLTLISIWGGLNEYSQRQVGDVEDRDLPVGQRNRLGYFFPGFTQLPFENEKGERGGVDVSRWTPLSALTTAAPPGSVPASFSERAPDILRAGGPVVDLAARFGANVDPYTGSPAYARDYPPSQNISSLLQDVAGTMLPSALDFHAERIKEDIANADWDKFKNDLLGPTGLRPRFIRPGANVVNASYQLDNSLREMKQDFRRSLRYNKNPDRIETLRRRYMARVHQAITNFTERTGQPPPPETLDSANPDTPLDEERRNTGTEKIRRP